MSLGVSIAPCGPICKHSLVVRLRLAQLLHLHGKVNSVIHGLEAGSLTPELAARILRCSVDETEAMAAQEAAETRAARLAQGGDGS